MNKKLENFARETLKKDLARCSGGERIVFKRMYSPENIYRSIFFVIDDMEAGKLDWAMEQVQRTLDKK